MTELYAKVNGIKISYEIYGKGYPVILVHGYGGSKKGWFIQIPALLKEFKVIAFDNRGSGKSDHPDYPYTMEMYSDDINGLMDFLKIEKAHVMGVSLGGMIVQNFILKYPERVNKLVLMNTFPGFPNTQGLELYRASKVQYYEDLKKNPLKTFLNSARGGYSREFRKMMEVDPKRKFYGLWSLEDLINNDLADPMTPQDINNAAAAIAKHNVTDRLHEIRSKTLVLCGEKDRLASVSINKLIHEKIPNSVFKIIMGAGHGSNLEKAPEVNKIILDFLKE